MKSNKRNKRYKRYKQYWQLAPLMLIALFMFMSLFTLRVKAADPRPVIIVIDPGHGGDNLGAEWNNVIEKDMTLFVAKCMRYELEKYDNVEVYLTRESDINLELNERADIAKKYNFKLSDVKNWIFAGKRKVREGFAVHHPELLEYWNEVK